MIHCLRPVAAFLALAIAMTGAAGAQDAAGLITLAERLQGEAEARAEALDAGTVLATGQADSFLADTARFSDDARTLADAIQATGGPADLPCIFRGMAEDAAARHAALEADPASAGDYRELARTFSHAVIIAADVETEGPDTGFPPSCPAAG